LNIGLDVHTVNKVLLPPLEGWGMPQATRSEESENARIVLGLLESV
jgi:hypothetical protein